MSNEKIVDNGNDNSGSCLALMSVRLDTRDAPQLLPRLKHGFHYGALAFQGIRSCQVPILTSPGSSLIIVK